MAHSHNRKFGSRAPGLFDNLDDFSGSDSADFQVIPPKKLRRAIADISASQPQRDLDELPPLDPADDLYFISFGSGSSGNCSYIGDRHSGFLIDAGVDARKVTDTLQANGIDMSAIKGICLTHDHGDHMKYVYQIVRKYRHIPVYCTPKAFNGLLRRHSISRRIKDYHSPIYKEFPFKIGNFEVTAFDVSHDGTDNAGFFITHGDKAVAVATDLGTITERVDHYMRKAQFIVIEANYDAAMLRDGRYPEYLKARIAADNGHLDNMVTAGYLASIYSPAIRAVFLCHLSHDNNTPQLALSAVTDALQKAGVSGFSDGVSGLIAENTDLILAALPRYDASPLYTLKLPR